MGINPNVENAFKEVERGVGLGLKGVMLDPEFHKFFRNDLPKVEAVIMTCMEYDLPVIFNTENIMYTGNESYYNGLDKLAFKFPKVKMVVNIWWPRVGELIRRNSNIFLCTGGHHNVLGLLPMLGEVGPTRIMMGSESPVMHPAMIMKDVRYKKMSPNYRKFILGENAKREFKKIL